MGFNKRYRSLFNIEILHHYFLDEGIEVYGDGLSESKMEKNLSLYKLSDFMDIRPSKKTVQLLRNTRSRFTQTRVGFQVATAEDEDDKPFIPFSNDLQLDFIATIKDPFFENYTNITIDRTAPLFLSNQTPSDSIEETAVPVRFCLLSDFETNLTNGETPTLPMVEKRIDLDEIGSRELLGIFAIIRIHLNGEGSEIDLSDGAGAFNGTLPEVNWIFENRATTWKYHRSSDSVQVHASSEELPLTKYGYITVKDVDEKQYPNPSVNMIYNGEDEVYKDKGGTPVSEEKTKKYSRIFI